MCPDTFNTKEVDRNRNMVPIIVQKGSADEENKSGASDLMEVGGITLLSVTSYSMCDRSWADQMERYVDSLGKSVRDVESEKALC